MRFRSSEARGGGNGNIIRVQSSEALVRITEVHDTANPGKPEPVLDNYTFPTSFRTRSSVAVCYPESAACRAISEAKSCVGGLLYGANVLPMHIYRSGVG